MRPLAWLFTAGEAALYFVRVDGCFGTVGGGGAEGNKSGVRRAGWRKARVRPSRSSCQTHGPAPGPARPRPPARDLRAGRDGLQPTCGVRARDCSLRTAATTLLRSAVSRRRVARAAATDGASKPKLKAPRRGRLGPRSTDLALHARWNPY